MQPSAKTHSISVFNAFCMHSQICGACIHRKLVIFLFTVFFSISSLCGFNYDDEITEAMLSEPVYEGETWVEKDSPLRIVCKISLQEPYALQWTINNEPLDTTLVKI